MFIIETNKFAMVFNHKCASRTISKDILGVDHSFLKYFSIEETVDYLDTIPSSVPKIVVVREPIDRYLSGYQRAEDLQDPVYKLEKYKDFDRMLRLHSDPYMYKIPKSLNFYIIDFLDISKYFNSNVGSSEKDTERRQQNIEYDQIPNMKEEIEQYDWILKNKEKISPEYLDSLLSNSSKLKLRCLCYRE